MNRKLLDVSPTSEQIILHQLFFRVEWVGTDLLRTDGQATRIMETVKRGRQRTSHTAPAKTTATTTMSRRSVVLSHIATHLSGTRFGVCIAAISVCFPLQHTKRIHLGELLNIALWHAAGWLMAGWSWSWCNAMRKCVFLHHRLQPAQ